MPKFKDYMGSSQHLLHSITKGCEAEPLSLATMLYVQPQWSKDRVFLWELFWIKNFCLVPMIPPSLWSRPTSLIPGACCQPAEANWARLGSIAHVSPYSLFSLPPAPTPPLPWPETQGLFVQCNYLPFSLSEKPVVSKDLIYSFLPKAKQNKQQHERQNFCLSVFV
jgi:hypothetical protein